MKLKNPFYAVTSHNQKEYICKIKIVTQDYHCLTDVTHTLQFLIGIRIQQCEANENLERVQKAS